MRRDLRERPTQPATRRAARGGSPSASEGAVREHVTSSRRRSKLDDVDDDFTPRARTLQARSARSSPCAPSPGSSGACARRGLPIGAGSGQLELTQTEPHHVLGWKLPKGISRRLVQAVDVVRRRRASTGVKYSQMFTACSLCSSIRSA